MAGGNLLSALSIQVTSSHAKDGDRNIGPVFFEGHEFCLRIGVLFCQSGEIGSYH